MKEEQPSQFSSTWGSELLDSYDGVPDHIIRHINEYVRHGRPLGHFLNGVLANDLTAVASHADDESWACLRRIHSYVFNRIPATCWGSREIVKSHYHIMREGRHD